MRYMSALAVATAALAGSLPVLAGTAHAQSRILSWPGKRPAPAAAPVAVEAQASVVAEQPHAAPAPRRIENRYSARSSAPVSTRLASSTIVATPAPQPVFQASTRQPSRIYPAPAPAPVQAEAFVAAPQPVLQQPREFARPTPRPWSPPQAVAQAAVRPVETAPVRAAAPAAAIDPQWAVREELMRRPPASSPAPAPTARAEAAPAPKPAAPTQPVVAQAPVKPLHPSIAPPAPAQQAAAGIPAPVAVPTAPSEPWRARAGETGPRFYSVHRQFGVTPDPSRSSAAPTGAAADPLPSNFFAANPTVVEDEAEEPVTERPVQQQTEKKKRSARRK